MRGGASGHENREEGAICADSRNDRRERPVGELSFWARFYGLAAVGLFGWLLGPRPFELGSRGHDHDKRGSGLKRARCPFSRHSTGSMMDCRHWHASWCVGGLPGSDGMPVVFSQEIDLETMQAGDFRVVLGDDREGEIVCVTPAPANDTGELRTILMVGEFGSAADPPLRVEITGNLLSMDHRFNFRGDQVDVTRLEDGPSLVLAESVPVEEWGLDQSATRFPFGGGSGCPASTRQVVRVVWNGGVTKPGGDEIDDVERSAYRVLVEDEAGEAREVSPFAIGDLGDGDNNHELCLDTEDPALRVAFPGGLVTDPREDLNLETAVTVTR